MSAARKKATPKKKAASKSKKAAAKKPVASTKNDLSNKLLASNYFANQQKHNQKLKNGKSKAKSKAKLAFFKNLSKRWSNHRHKRVLKKDRRLRKRASYLSELPQTPWQRLLYKLHPKKILRSIFSLRSLILFLKIGLVSFVLGLASLAVLYLYYRQDVPTSIASLQSCISGQSTKYFDRTAKILLWSSKSDFDCQPIQLDKVSPHLINALITIEDKDFYNHSGVEFKSIVRAGLNNILDDSSTQGGSTITQQYIKNAILQDSSRTLDRKIKEVILAIEVERTFEKDEILSAYLNTISFGSIYSGVEAAAQGYLGKSAADLTLEEAALLVAALPAPTTFWSDSEAHLQRQQWVLAQMLANDVIDRKAYDKALAVDILSKIRVSHEQYESIRAPHFILETEQRLTEELCGFETSATEEESDNCDNIRLRGYTVITTLDVDAQTLAEQAVETTLPQLPERGFDNAALVAIDATTGKVIALVGSRDFQYAGFGQNNTVTQQRDPGSTFKLFDYGALIENSSDWGPGSLIYDYSTTFDNRGWTPENYSRRHHGPITMRSALGNSLNIPAVKAMYVAGMENVHGFAQQAGIRTDFPCVGGCGLASAFGAGVEVRLDELANAYATFSRSGVYMPLTYIDRVLDAEGKILRQWRQKPERVFRSETSYLLNHMLSDKSARFTTLYNLDPSLQTTMALKTGTDDNYINNHVIGFSKSVVAAGWIGHHDEAVTFDSERSTAAPKSTLLKSFMEPYHRNLPFEKKNHWARPAGIKKVAIDLLTGYQASNEDQSEAAERSRIDIFPSWYSPKISPSKGDLEVVDIDILSGKIATVCTPRRAVERIKALKINDELNVDDPFYDAWMTPIQEGLKEEGHFVFTGAGDDLHGCDDRLPSIQIISQPDTCSNLCPIAIEVMAGTFDLSSLNVIHDGRIINEANNTLKGRSQKVTYNYRPLNANSAPEERGILRIEIVDEGLYDANVNVLLNIAGFPEPQEPSEEITLLSAEINPAERILRVAWDGYGRSLELIFDGNCREEPLVYLPTEINFKEIDISSFPAAACEVYIRYNGNRRSNRLYFDLRQEDIIEEENDNPQP